VVERVIRKFGMLFVTARIVDPSILVHVEETHMGDVAWKGLEDN